MKTWTCQGYRGMDAYKWEFTVEAETEDEALRKAWKEHPFADAIQVNEVPAKQPIKWNVVHSHTELMDHMLKDEGGL